MVARAPDDRAVRRTAGRAKGAISYGVSSYGYDMRVADEFKIFTNICRRSWTPSPSTRASFVEFKGDVCIVPPNSFALARSVEYFRIPRNVLTICVGKSTYARCGIITNVTPFEPEWEGIVTLEMSNTTPLPAKIYANEGIAQVLFFEARDEPCETSYADKKGKYQGRGWCYSAQRLPVFISCRGPNPSPRFDPSPDARAVRGRSP